MDRHILRPAIVILALADGVLHLALDFILFRGQFFHNLLSQLFLLNFVGFIVLTVVFLWGEQWLGQRQWVVDVMLILYAAATLIGWWIFGHPNPMGLGYTSKVLEVLLILALVAHLRASTGEMRSIGPAES